MQKTVGNVTVKVKLYGEISKERMERELRTLDWRLEQLQPYKKPEHQLHIDGKGMAYPIIDGKIRWNYWEMRGEDD